MTEPSDDAADYGSLDYRNVRRISIGRYEFDTWFGNSALFLPNEPSMLAYRAIAKGIKRSNSKVKRLEYDTARKPWIDTLYFCPYCFKYSDIQSEIDDHFALCKYGRQLPGKVMYYDRNICIRKIKGTRHRLFCQCFCLLAKFFLDSKSIFYNMENYDFFVVYKKIEKEDEVPVPMGFFSREVLSWDNNNLSCIFVVPCYQKHHLGTKLVDFSYCLSRSEQLISGPERPLSPLGKLTYLKYWAGRLCVDFIYGSLSSQNTVSLELISAQTGFREDDVLMALDYMQAFYEVGTKDKYGDYYSEPPGSDLDYVFLKDENFKLYIDKSSLKQWVIDHHIRDQPILDPKGLLLY